MDNLKKYLPSKKFITVVLIIVAFLSLFFTIRELVSFIKNRNGIKADKNGRIEVTVSTRIQKDSNSNGIPDWEEYLWNLDPYKNGSENKEFILAKKKALINSGEMTLTDDSEEITDNEILSRQFFATIMSLQQTGELNDESIKSVAEALGKNVEATPIPDVYTTNMLKIQDDSLSANTIYNNNLSKLINNYANSDIGSELTFIIQGLNNEDPSALYAAVTVAEAYQSFGRELIKMPVPKSLSSIHLDMANNYEKTGQSIKDLSKMLSDPIIGMRSIINYKNYSEALALDLEKLSEILQ